MQNERTGAAAEACSGGLITASVIKCGAPSALAFEAGSKGENEFSYFTKQETLRARARAGELKVDTQATAAVDRAQPADVLQGKGTHVHMPAHSREEGCCNCPDDEVQR